MKDMEGCNPIVMPAVNETRPTLESDGPLDQQQFTTVCAAAARCINVSMDRPNCQIASKKVSRPMAAPTFRGRAALKRA